MSGEPLAMVVGTGPAAGAWAERPNIPFILVRDLGYGDIGRYEQREFETPNIDRIAHQGVGCVGDAELRQFLGVLGYAQRSHHGPLPDRLRAGHEESINSRTAKGSNTIGLSQDYSTLPTLLREAGHGTPLVGEWHLSYLPHLSPPQSGYDRFLGLMYGDLDHVMHRDRPPLDEGTTFTTRRRWSSGTAT